MSSLRSIVSKGKSAIAKGRKLYERKDEIITRSRSKMMQAKDAIEKGQKEVQKVKEVAGQMKEAIAKGRIVADKAKSMKKRLWAKSAEIKKAGHIKRVGKPGL
jgi:hypothetical protein